jgi:hypothetical protein
VFVVVAMTTNTTQRSLSATEKRKDFGVDISCRNCYLQGEEKRRNPEK